jgi:DNA polymerase-3 subunit gamma/tau
MYQVIARKYRPQSFEDVVNQEHVKQTLVNALTQGRVGHGYIFSGPRGTGKTTMARILAKALNCEKGPSPTPCQQCSSCREIAAGNSMDLVEIDAASNRRIDDIRELRENVRYRPVRDRHKVFIIDEAHQITADAFNALLKTLEEPPEWVVFILCTTEPQQFPATIVSRCQSFPFRTVEMEDVVGRMQWICEQEGIQAEPDALVAIALSGDGSIRDSLSTLDQAIASFGQKLEAGPVRDLLGAIPSEIAENILEALRGQDANAMLGIVDRLAREGRHLQHFCGELTRYFRNLLVIKVSGGETRLVTTGPDERKRLTTWAEKFSQEDLTRYMNLLVDLYRDLQNAPQPRFRLEIGLLKLVYAGRLEPLEKVLAGWNPGTASSRGAGPAAPNKGGELSAASVELRAGNGAAHPVESSGQRQPEERPAPLAQMAAAAAVGGSYPTVAATQSGRETVAPPPAPPPSAASGPGVGETRKSGGPGGGTESRGFEQPATANAPVHAPVHAPAGAPAGAIQASDVRMRLAEAMRAEGDDSLADALEHGRVSVNGGVLEVQTLPDYRVLVEMGQGMIEEAARAVLGASVRVKLGNDLAPGDGEPGPKSGGRATGGSASPPAGQSAPGPSEAVQRALADPEVQHVQKLFTGQVREVRDLRGYTT